MTFKSPVEMTFTKAFFSTVCAMLLFLTTAVNATNISAFGDSITIGEGSDTGGYPPKLSSLLNATANPQLLPTLEKVVKTPMKGFGGSTRFSLPLQPILF